MLDSRLTAYSLHRFVFTASKPACAEGCRENESAESLKCVLLLDRGRRCCVGPSYLGCPECRVPEPYTYVALTNVPKRGGNLFRIGIIGFATICHSAWACGIGRRLLDELATQVRSGLGRSGTQATSDGFHEQYAKAEAAYRGARALVYEAWTSAKDTLDRGDALSVRQQTMIRLAMANVTWTSHDVAELVYKSAGTVALRSGTIQRLFRDMHAGTQHVTSAPPVIRNAGRELAGLAEGKTWVFLDLT
jgi:acyl-CoA dehydrogenase-like protein